MARKVLKYGIGLFILAGMLAGRWHQLEVRAMRGDPEVLSALNAHRLHPDTTVLSASNRALNQRRFTAAQIIEEGDTTRLHGSVVMKLPGVEVHAEDAEPGGLSGEVTIHGDARLTLLKLRANPDGPRNQFAGLPSTDPRRFAEGEIRREGTTTLLRGDVWMQLPGIVIHAENADMDSSTATITIRGDSRFIFLKVAVDPDDDLGPWYLPQ